LVIKIEIGRLIMKRCLFGIFLIVCLGHVQGHIAPLDTGFDKNEKLLLRDKTLEMFRHAYNSYMTHAYPADELMPLSCKGRTRGKTPSRGDIDDALGNFQVWVCKVCTRQHKNYLLKKFRLFVKI